MQRCVSHVQRTLPGRSGQFLRELDRTCRPVVTGTSLFLRLLGVCWPGRPGLVRGSEAQGWQKPNAIWYRLGTKWPIWHNGPFGPAVGPNSAVDESFLIMPGMCAADKAKSGPFRPMGRFGPNAKPLILGQRIFGRRGTGQTSARRWQSLVRALSAPGR